jgi:microcystin-dependent protein
MDPLIGEIKMFAGEFAPRGWLFCQGQLLPIAQNTALFSILGTTYGGDGRTTFALPDLRGRVAMGEGNGPDLTPRRLGQKSGVEEVVLNIYHMPSHTHRASFTATNDPEVTTKVNAHNGEGNVDNAKDAYFATGGSSDGRTTILNKHGYSTSKDVTMKSDVVEVSVSKTEGTVSVSNTGGGEGLYNMQPYSVINYIIAVEGVFPPRP